MTNCPCGPYGGTVVMVAQCYGDTVVMMAQCYGGTVLWWRSGYGGTVVMVAQCYGGVGGRGATCLREPGVELRRARIPISF